MAEKFKCASKLIYNLIHDFLSTKQTSFVKKTWLKAAKSGSCFQAACRFSSHSCVTIQSAVGNTDCPGFGQNQVIPKTKKKKTKKKELAMQFGSNNFSQCLLAFWPATGWLRNRGCYCCCCCSHCCCCFLRCFKLLLICVAVVVVAAAAAAAAAVFEFSYRVSIDDGLKMWMGMGMGMGLGMWLGITSASPGMWKCCCNFCCCCCRCCCILLCLVYCTNARFGPGLHTHTHTQYGTELIPLSQREIEGERNVWGLPLSGSLKTHLNQRQHPLRRYAC